MTSPHKIGCTGPEDCRSATRLISDDMFGGAGFRVVLDAPDQHIACPEQGGLDVGIGFGGRFCDQSVMDGDGVVTRRD